MLDLKEQFQLMLCCATVIYTLSHQFINCFLLKLMHSIPTNTQAEKAF